MNLRDLLTQSMSIRRNRDMQDRRGLNLAGLQSAQRSLPDGTSYDTVTTTQGAQPVPTERTIPRNRVINAVSDATLGPGLSMATRLYGKGAQAFSNRFSNKEQAPQPAPQPVAPQQPMVNDPMHIDPFAGGVGGGFSMQSVGTSQQSGGMDFSNMTAGDLANMTPEQLYNLREALMYDAGAQMVGDESTPIDQMYTRANALAGISDNAGRNAGQYASLEDTVGNIYKPQIDRISNLIDLKGSSSSSTGGGSGSGQYDGIVNTLLATGKYTKAQADQIRSAINMGEDPKNVILRTAKNNLATDERNELIANESALGAMQNLNRDLEEFYALGGNTNIFRGKWEKVNQRLGRTTDPELAAVQARIRRSIDAYRKAITGTAASIQEDRNIESVFPGIDKGEALNNALAQSSQEVFREAIDRLYSSAIGQGAYQSLMSQQSQPTVGGQMPQGGQVIQTSIGAINTNW